MVECAHWNPIQAIYQRSGDTVAHSSKQGFGLADAAHVAFAEVVAAESVTRDDRLLR